MMKVIIVDFSKNTSLQNWRVVDDVVMGGRSSGNFKLNDDGHAVFFGNVSTANNGGFSSIRLQIKPINIQNEKFAVLRIKGDGKKYQFRIKDKSRRYFSYVKSFQTQEEKDWETIKIPLSSMSPQFRGRILEYSNFDKNTIEEIAILIGNKRNESFELQIDKIYLE